jgi:hypothetical protein
MSLQEEGENMRVGWNAFAEAVIERFRIKQIVEWIAKKLERMF